MDDDVDGRIRIRIRRISRKNKKMVMKIEEGCDDV
jgi:hypothetical protein